MLETLHRASEGEDCDESVVVKQPEVHLHCELMLYAFFNLLSLG